LQNAINVTYPAIGREINREDFIALETIRLYEPSLFAAIYSRKHEVCGTSGQGLSKEALDKKMGECLVGIPADRSAAAKQTLQRLFPRLGTSGFGHEWLQRWDSERRVCVESHFDSYFRLVLSGDVLPNATIASLIERAGDKEVVVGVFRAAAGTFRKGKGSMIPVYLDELNTHADKIARADVGVLLGALFGIYDEIDLKLDAAARGNRLASTSLLMHWLIRRLTRDRFNMEERTDLYLAALRNASLGWLVDFASSAQSSYSSPENRAKHEGNFLILEQALGGVIADALQAIRSAAADMSLLRHANLQSILYRWRDFQDGDCREVLAWTNSILTSDEALVILARAFTGESWTTGLGGFGSLGDRVSKRNLTAQISDDVGILNVTAFRAGLERIELEAILDKESLETVRQFLVAWKKQP
jgi:predicted KAP-like P-loop ATPase